MKQFLLLLAIATTILGLGSGCSTNLGYGLSPALALDISRGTYYINPKLQQNFDYNLLDAPERVRVFKISCPFTYGLLSFGWGNLDMQRAMLNSRMEDVMYADYDRFVFLGLVESYVISFYGPRKPRPFL